MRKDDEVILELVKMAQSGQIKTALDELNQSVSSLQLNLHGFTAQLKELNKDVSDSSLHLKEITELNRSAKSLTDAMVALTMAILALTATQVFTPFVGALPALLLGLFIAIGAFVYILESRKQAPR